MTASRSSWRTRRPDWRAIALTLTLVASWACDHSPPFGAEVPSPEGPLTPVPPIHLTYNTEEDLYPQWLPGDTGILYGARYGDPRQRDRCLAVVPPAGGRRLQEWCKETYGGLDSTEVLGPATVSPGGRLAYEYRQTRYRGSPAGPHYLALASVVDPLGAVVVHSLPLILGGVTIDAIRDPHWIDDSHLVYVGVEFVPNVGGPIPTGKAVFLVDLTGAAPRLTEVPGTAYTSSLALAEDGDLITTVAADSRVFRRALAETPTVLYDFGSAGIARDVSIRGSLLAAVVGGGVRYIPDAVFGAKQSDIGGPVMVVDLVRASIVFVSPPSGVTPSPVPDQKLFRRPVLGPLGALVFEGHPFIEVVTGEPPNLQVDTLVSGTPDLWRIEVP